jgi:terminase large subunit-like protein
VSKTLTILDAINDKAIFSSVFKDRDTWVAWTSFLAALFGLPHTTTEQRRIFRQCTKRNDRPRVQATEAILVVGRRGGKSFVLALIACFLASFRDWRPYLTVGERATIMVIAADRRQAKTIVRYVKGLMHSVPMLKATIESETQESVNLNNRVTIEVATASFRTTRGFTVVACLADEIAFWRDETSANPDTAILAAIRPAMATVPGAMLLMASSPYSRKGALWEEYQRHFGKEGSVLCWQASTRTMNPSISQAFLDREYEKDAVSASAEYGAQFRTDIENFVSREAVEACISLGVHERPFDPRHTYTGFVDPSGGSSDSFTLAVGHNEGERRVLDVLREITPPFSPSDVVAEFATVLKSYRVRKINGDRYAGAWPVEAFDKFNIEYEQNAQPKSDIYRDSLPLLNSGQVQLIDNRKLFNQIVGLERRTARGGRDSIDHAPGAHDDCANAALGVIVALEQSPYDIRKLGTHMPNLLAGIGGGDHGLGLGLGRSLK